LYQRYIHIAVNLSILTTVPQASHRFPALKVFIAQWATVDLIKAYLHTRKKDGKKRGPPRRSTPATGKDDEVFEPDTGYVIYA
jgi:hypothetical protein